MQPPDNRSPNMFSPYQYREVKTDYTALAKRPCGECGNPHTMYVTAVGPFCKDHKAEAILAQQGKWKRKLSSLEGKSLL